MGGFVAAVLAVCVFGSCEQRFVTVKSDLCGYTIAPHDITLRITIRCDDVEE